MPLAPTPRVRTAAAVLVALVTLAGCGGSGGATGPSPKKDAKSAPTSAASGGADSSADTDGDTDGDEPTPLMLDTQRWVSPCRLFTGDDVQRVYGPLGPYATFDQEYREQGLTAAQMRIVDRTASRSVDDKCSYTFGNKKNTALYVEVEQYSSPALALQSWKGIRKLGTGRDSRQLARDSAAEWLVEMARENEKNLGGFPVPGMQASVLYSPHYGNFVGVRGNLVIKVSRKDYDTGNVFEPSQIKGDLARMRQVYATIYQRADDASLDQSPLPGYWTQPDGWPELVDPCAVFDDEVMAAGTGHRSYRGEAETMSAFLDPAARKARNDLPAFQAVDNECDRTARSPYKPGQLSQDWILRGEVWYAAPGTTGQQLLEGLPVKRLFAVDKQRKYHVADLVKAKVLTTVDVPGADAAYLFDYTKPGLGRISWLMASSGDRVVYVDAEQPVTKKKGNLFDNGPVPKAQMVAATAKALENLKTLTD